MEQQIWWEITLKTCSKCKLDLPETDFHKNSSKPDGLAHYCKSCKSDSQRKHRSVSGENLNKKKREWVANNKERVASYNSEYKSINKHRCAEYEAKRRSKMQHDVGDNERAEMQYLYWLAKDLEVISGEKYHVDHIIPLSKGGEHRLNNLQILPADINLKKSDKIWHER